MSQKHTRYCNNLNLYGKTLSHAKTKKNIICLFKKLLFTMENATAADSSQSNSRKNQEIVSFCSNEYQKQTLYPSKNLYR